MFQLGGGATINGVVKDIRPTAEMAAGRGRDRLCICDPWAGLSRVGAEAAMGARCTVCLGPYAVSGNPATECGNGGPANDDPVHPSLFGSRGLSRAAFTASMKMRARAL